MPKFIQLLVLGVLLSISLGAISDTLKIVSTIKPVALILDAIIGSEQASDPLLPQGASPHHFRLKPSDFRRLWAADLVFWVGPEFESFLIQPMRQLSSVKSVVSLGDGLMTVPGDAHIWLDPTKAASMGRRILEELEKIDSENIDKYRENMKGWAEKLNKLDIEISQTLSAAPSLAYILQHQSLDYFEARYGLSHLGLLSSGAEHQISVKSLLYIEDLLTSGQAKCVVLEPDFPAKLVESINISKRSHIIRFDPMMFGSVDYMSEIEKLGLNLSKCV